MKKFKLWLDNANLKKTKHRLLVLEILNESDEFLSADDIFIHAKQRDTNISLSTVYRILDSFLENHIVSTVQMENTKQVYYEIAHKEHAHHLMCLDCQKVIHIRDCPIHDYEAKLSAMYNFEIERHSLAFYGYCQPCQKKRNNQKLVKKSQENSV